MRPPATHTPNTTQPPRPPLRLPQVLVVVEQPQREAGEASADYALRVQNERVLMLNPNYALE